jgi:hypothetical protein
MPSSIANERYKSSASSPDRIFDLIPGSFARSQNVLPGEGTEGG